MSRSFVHLHCHSSYSILDGAARIKDMVRSAVADGQPGIAVTDHGNVYSLIEFYKECNKAGIKPILGMEAYLAKGSRLDKTAGAKRVDEFGETVSEQGGKLYYHVTLLAENNTGYHNLLRISSDAYINGYRYKPRTDLDALSQHSDGIIATTGCLGGMVLQHLLHDNYDKALESAAVMQDIFGRDNLFVELQNHGLAEQFKTNPQLIQIARSLGAPLIATNDTHYCDHADCKPHDALLAIQTKALLSDENRFRFKSDQHYIKSALEMRSLFSEVPEACDNTLLIAERANVNIDLGKIRLPAFPLPEGYSKPIQYLTDLAFDSITRRDWRNDLSVSEGSGGGKANDLSIDEVLSRLNHELAVIDRMGFSSYFLIVWDLVKYATDSGIRIGPGRGSASGSLVSYALGITKVDPIRNKLIFERFLNPDRVSMPDVDLDIAAKHRDKMIAYAAEKYGEDHVAQIITFSQIKAKSAIRDANRVRGNTWMNGDAIVKLLPEGISGREPSLDDCFDPDSEFYAGAEGFRELYSADPEVAEIVDVARGIEGLHRSESIHAAAVVISDEPLQNIVPLRQKPNEPLTTQYDMNAIEELGLLKMDFLGLRNLDVIDDCLSMIKDRHGVDIDIDNIPLDDMNTYDLLCKGQSVGVFQLESNPMRKLLVRLRPSSIDDIAAVVALYRPGPMGTNMHTDYADRKNGVQAAVPFHPDAADILDDTYQLMIYQEQVMQVAQRFAGYSMSEADTLRKVIGKKVADGMKREREKFIPGCIANGYSGEFAGKLFDMIDHFSSYAFNRSHAYGYGMISYQTAYLKANYPLEYMAALCTSVADKLEKSTIFISEIRDMGFKVYGPSVNSSLSDFSVEPDGIRIGLNALKGLGSATSLEIENERQKGRFVSLIDFCKRVNLNKKTFIAIAHSGALDEFGYSRLGLESVADEYLKAAKKAVRDVDAGQSSLFADEETFDLPVPDAEFPRKEFLLKERETLGVFVSGHPIEAFKTETDSTLTELIDGPIDTTITVSGVITALKIWRTKASGAEMAVIQFEDREASIEVMIFPKTWDLYKGIISTLAGVEMVIRKQMNMKDIEPRYVVLEAKALESEEEERAEMDGSFRIYLPKGFVSYERGISQLKGAFLSHRGTKEVVLQISGSSVMKLGSDFMVDPSAVLLDKISSIFEEFRGRINI